MHGNVWEWVEDAYRNSYVGVPSDGSPWRGESSSSRVLRGGSWYDIPFNLRSSARDGYVADGRSHTYGFRVARTLGQPARPRPTTVTSSRNFDQSH